jgi:hypothetical protein
MRKKQRFENLVTLSLAECRGTWTETVSRDFRPLVFFHKSIVPRPLSNTLKYFRILCWIRGDIRDYVLRYIVRSHDYPLCNIALSRLRAMQPSGEFLLKIFAIEIRLDCIARGSSAILVEKNSALCNLARSQNCIARSQLTELWLCATAFKATIKQIRP